MSLNLRRAAVVLFGIVYVAALALCQPPGGTGKPAKPTKPGLPEATGEAPTEFNGLLQLPLDRKLKAKLEAADDYVKDENWADAIKILQSLNDAKQDCFAAVPRDGTFVWVSIKTEANRRIGKLPEEGKKFYRDQYDVDAKADLLKGMEQHKWELVARVATIYLHTTPGGVAAEALASHYLDMGDFHASALYFDKLIERNSLENLNEISLVKAAIAFHSLQVPGKENDESTRTFNGIMQKIKDKYPNGVTIGGQKVALADFQQALGQFKSVGGQIVKDETQYPGGSPSRNSPGRGTEPFLDKQAWHVETVRVADVRSTIEGAIENMLRAKQAVMPAMFPITTKVVKTDGSTVPTVIFRSFLGIHAVDMRSGKLLWEAEMDWAPDKLAKGSPQQWTMVKQWIPGVQGAQLQLWDNSVVGTISTDGQRVYVMDDLYVAPPRNPNPNWGGWPPQPFIQDPKLAEASQFNRLKAYDARSGKYLWCLGGATGDKTASPATKDLLGSYFLGEPLPLNGKLYVLSEKERDLRLLCLDPSVDPNKQNPVVWSQALAEVRRPLLDDPQRRLEASHLAYGQGMMVCPTNAGAVLGVDLMSHSLVWAHPYRENKSGTEYDDFGGGGPWGGKRPFPQPTPNSPVNTPQWKSTPPIVEDGKVVFAPQDGEDLICLNLKDGSLQWRYKRQPEDQYLAGVFGDKVLVVGNNTAKAFKLNSFGSGGNKYIDGPVWTATTGMPSGVGVASGNFYYLPLRWSAQNPGKPEPEICIIEMETGKLAHDKSRKKDLPGNLVFFEGRLISQTTTEITAYPELRVVIEEADKALADNPNDPTGRVKRAELRLFKGDRNGAIEDLRVARDNNPPAAVKAQTTKLLHEAFTELLLNDFAANEKCLTEYRQVCTVDDPDLTGDAKAGEERRRNGIYWHIVAQGREKQGKLKDAFEGYMEYIKNAPLPKPGEANVLLTSLDQPAVQARPDVWARGRITAMLSKSTEEQRKPLEELIEAKWNEAKASGGIKEMTDFTNMFGPQFKVGREARLMVAEKLMELEGTKELTQAEMQLLQLRGQKEDKAMAARALDALARLMTRKNMLDEGAYYYRVLSKEYPDVVVRDGKTGTDLYSELATDKRYIGVIDQPGQFLAGAKLEGKKEAGAPKNWSIYTFETDGEALPYFQKNKIQFDMQVSKFRVADRFTDTEVCGVGLQPNQWFSFIVNQGHAFNSAARFPVSTVGHIVVVQTTHMVYGVDPIQKTKLWEVNLMGVRGGVPPINPQFGQPQVMIDPRDGTVIVVYSEGYSQRLGAIGPVSSTCVCLATKDQLVALDPRTGETLWTRNDVTSRSTLFGDGEYIFAVELGDDNQTPKSGRIFRAQDGVTVDAPNFIDAYQNRMRLVGRNILVKDGGGTGVTVRLYDPIAGKDVWTEKFPLNSVVMKTEDADLAGVVDPEGHAVGIDVNTGKKVLQAVLDPKGLGGIKGGNPPTVTLLRDSGLFYVLVNLPSPQPVQTNLFADTGMRGLPVNGDVYAYDKGTFKMKWKAELKDTMLIADNFKDMPVLLFTGRYFTAKGGKGGFGGQFASVQAFQKSNGKRVFDEVDNQQLWQFYSLKMDSKAGKIEFIGQNAKIVIKPTENTETGAPGGGGVTPGGQEAVDTPLPIGGKPKLPPIIKKN